MNLESSDVEASDWRPRYEQSLSRRLNSLPPATELAVNLFDNCLDPIETEVRARSRQFIEELIRSELDAALARPSKESTVFYVFYAILGGICSVLGGYVSARIAKHDELLNGALSSILCVGGGLYAVISGRAADDLWMHLVFLPLSPALGALGGLLRARQHARLG